VGAWRTSLRTRRSATEAPPFSASARAALPAAATATARTSSRAIVGAAPASAACAAFSARRRRAAVATITAATSFDHRVATENDVAIYDDQPHGRPTAAAAPTRFAAAAPGTASSATTSAIGDANRSLESRAASTASAAASPGHSARAIGARTTREGIADAHRRLRPR
jgi:hypothetical protein